MGNLRTFRQRIVSFIARIRHQNQTKLRGSISDKIARDLGLDQATLAQLRHQWPSEMTDQARLKELVSRAPRR